jgi:hypothetical protein
MGGFFYAGSVTLTASPWGLWRHHVAKVEIREAQLYTKPLYETLDRLPSGSAVGIDWTIGQFELSRGLLMLDNLVAGTSIPVRLGVRHPIVLRGLRLGKPDSSPGMNLEQTVEIGVVNIGSPVDPLARVLLLPLTRVRFTWRELWHHQIRDIEVVHPTLYLGEDLFWFSKQFKKESAPSPKPGPEAPWRVAHLEVQFGQLAVNAFGQPVVHFPFFFDTKVDNIRLDQLDQISAKATIPIRRLSQDYPDYKVRIVNLSGRLYFSLPPGDATANNVVNTISIDEISWNDIPVKAVSTTLTFDPSGVYGKLNGECEGGELAGNFEFYYTKGFAWNANFFANHINCQPIAEKLASKTFDLTGELDGRIAVQGKATEILNCVGTLSLPHPGLFQIKSMDELMDRLPPGTIALKRDALRIAISAIQTYPYDSGQVNIKYTPAGGAGTMKLESPRGQRLFQVYWHPWSLTEDK